MLLALTIVRTTVVLSVILQTSAISLVSTVNRSRNYVPFLKKRLMITLKPAKNWIVPHKSPVPEWLVFSWRWRPTSLLTSHSSELDAGEVEADGEELH